METNKRPTAILVFLGFTVLACQLVSSVAATPTPAPTFTATVTPTRTPLPTSTPRPTATVHIEGGVPRTLEGGGFIFSPLLGYELDATNNHAYLQNGTDTVSISLSAQAPFPGEHINSTLKYLLGYLQENYKEFEAGPRTQVSVNGVEGPSTDFKGLYNNELVQGRVTVLSGSDTKYLTILILAFGEGRWEIEAEEAYTTILQSIKLFRPRPSKDCPVAASRNYGYSENNPIKIGGDLLQGSDREGEYLSLLLGARGELISYYLEGSKKVNGVTLDEYTIYAGNDAKTLYLNAYEYEPPMAPFDMKCSAKFPGKP